jgi:hypothetical protein
MAMTSATAADERRGSAPASAAITVAATIAAGLRRKRARKRESRDACGEKQPGHRKISFRTVKTARPPRRSHS